MTICVYSAAMWECFHISKLLVHAKYFLEPLHSKSLPVNSIMTDHGFYCKIAQ